MQTELPKKYLTYQKLQTNISIFKKIKHITSGLILSPIYWGMAYAVNTPGLIFRKYFVFIGIRFLLKKHDLRNSYRLIVTPLDSLRYFEFDFMWQSIMSMNISTYLDVSSPRLFPLMLTDRYKNINSDLINPDKRDLAETILMAETLGIENRCKFHANLIEDAPLKPSSFDLITSISVIEHIADDNGAIQKIWDFLKPGGKLLITIPCSAEAYEEHINQNDYGLDNTNKDGFFFFQRYYDEKLIQERIFSITGKPIRYKIYGEKKSGIYQHNETEKRTNPLYPYWRTPFYMGMKYDYMQKISDLPGIGVIAFEFIKQ